MQQQIQVQQPAQQVVQEGVSFFSRRGARVIEQDDRGFRMSLAGDGGRVTVTPTVEGGSVVTVEAEGLGVMALADQFVRDLRKQSRLQARNGERPARAGGPVTLRGGFGDLRERLGMPEPPRQEQADELQRPRAAAPQAQRPPRRRGHAPQSAAASARGGETPPAEGMLLEPAMATPPSAEQAGGVPSPTDVELHTPSASSSMASGAGSPASPPVVDPSTSHPGQPVIEGVSQLSRMPEGESQHREERKPEHETGA